MSASYRTGGKFGLSVAIRWRNPWGPFCDTLRRGQLRSDGALRCGLLDAGRIRFAPQKRSAAVRNTTVTLKKAEGSSGKMERFLFDMDQKAPQPAT